MLAHFEIVYMYLKKNRILFQGKERPAKKKNGAGKTPCSVSLRGVDSTHC